MRSLSLSSGFQWLAEAQFFPSNSGCIWEVPTYSRSPRISHQASAPKPGAPLWLQELGEFSLNSGCLSELLRASSPLYNVERLGCPQAHVCALGPPRPVWGLPLCPASPWAWERIWNVSRSFSPPLSKGKDKSEIHLIPIQWYHLTSKQLSFLWVN